MSGRTLLKITGTLGLVGLLAGGGAYIARGARAAGCDGCGCEELQESIRRLEQEVAWMRRELEALETPVP